MTLSPRTLVVCEGLDRHVLGTWVTMRPAMPYSVPRTDRPGNWFFAVCPECAKAGIKSAAWWPDPASIVRWTHTGRPRRGMPFTLFLEGSLEKQIQLELALKVNNSVTVRPESWQPIESAFAPENEWMLDPAPDEESAED